MTLCEQNIDLNCEMRASRLEGRFGFLRLVRIPLLKQSFANFRTAAAIVYGQRFKEMRRNQEAVQHLRQTGNVHSQLSRQTPK